jgi:tetratricopeptide (TPR) repeat protein
MSSSGKKRTPLSLLAFLSTAIAAPAGTLPAIAPHHQESAGFQEKSLPYLEIVEMYRQREYGDALEQTRKLNPQEVTNMVVRWEEMPFRPEDEDLQAAALLHTDFAMQLVSQIKFHAAGFQHTIAERFIDRIRNRSKRDGFQRDWLLALGYFYQTIEFSLGVDGFEYAKQYYDEAVKRFPNDAEVLLSAGTLYEHKGSLKHGEKKHLKKARDLYRRALSADPRLAEAHLRYGRVLEKRGEFDKAKGPLQTALELNESPFINYVALLMLGRIAERERDFEAAMGHYRTAIDRLPEWQVAYVALSHVLHAMGRTKESADVLATTMEARITSSQNFDGWMIYEEGRTNHLAELWKKMREEVSN